MLSRATETDPSPLTVLNMADDDRERILIVDDSQTMRTSFVRQLSKRYRCFQADSFMGALDRLREDDFAVVIADIQMPGISGVELLRKIVEKYKEASVIMVSGVDRPQVVLDTMRLFMPRESYPIQLHQSSSLRRISAY